MSFTFIVDGTIVANMIVNLEAIEKSRGIEVK